MRLPVLLADLLVGALAAATSAQSVGLEALPQRTPDQSFVAGERYTVMHIGQANPALGGLFPLASPETRVSLRFAAQADRTIDTVWLRVRRIGSPGGILVALRDDDGAGRPVGVQPASSAIVGVPFDPLDPSQPIWLQVPLEQPKALVRGTTYHVTIEPRAGSFTPDDTVEIVTARSRFPLPWQPRAFAPAPGALVPMRSPRDESLGVMLDVGDGEGLLLQRANLRAYVPVFALGANDGTPLGQPFDQHVEIVVSGPTRCGQVFVPARPITFDYVSFFTRGTCPESSQACLDALDPLVVTIRHHEGADWVPVAPPSVLLDPETEGLRAGRSHWFAAFLDGPLGLEQGEEYLFELSSPGSSGEGFVFSAELSTLPLPPDDVPSYLGASSYAVRSDDGGTSWQPVPGGEADAGFVLALGLGRDQPRAVFDEFNALSSQQDYPVTACPGDEIVLGVLNRNVGAYHGPPTLFGRLLDAQSGELYDDAVWQSLLPEQESHQALAFTMPDHDLSLRLELGHFEAFGQQIVDDVVVLEVRRRVNGCR